MNALYYFYTGIGFIYFAQLTDSLSLFVIDKYGRINDVQKPIHIDAKYASKDIQERLEKQFHDFLSQRQNPLKRKPKMRSYSFNHELRNSSNVVIYSDGRYTLDLDKIDIGAFEDINNQQVHDGQYYDTAETFRDYYDYMNKNERLHPNKLILQKELPKRHSSLRKTNRIENGGKKLTGEIATTQLLIKKLTKSIENAKRSFTKRFKVIDNKKKHKKNKKKQIRYETEEHSSTEEKPKDRSLEESFQGNDESSFEAISAEKVTESSVESARESDDDSLYLQGSDVIGLQAKVVEESKHSGDIDTDIDSRRRLKHFMPKRFHWKQDEIKDLGYFWYNGPKGKYPDATPLR